MKDFPMQAGWNVTRVLLIAVTYLTCAGSVSARSEQPPVAEAEILLLIEQLGDDLFQNRERTKFRLTEVCQTAELATSLKIENLLRQAAKRGDAETRLRAKVVLRLVEQRTWELQREAFLADVGGKQGITFPAWEKFRDRVGDDVAARELFARMTLVDGELLEAYARGKEGGADNIIKLRAIDPTILAIVEAVKIRGEDVLVHPAYVIMPLETMVTMIFVGSDPDLELPDHARQFIRYLGVFPAIKQELKNSESTIKDPLQRLLDSVPRERE